MTFVERGENPTSTDGVSVASSGLGLRQCGVAEFESRRWMIVRSSPSDRITVKIGAAVTLDDIAE